MELHTYADPGLNGKKIGYNMYKIITRGPLMAHIRIQERLKIETLLHANKSQAAIAKQLGRSEACISREISRNSRNGEYCHNVAQKLHDERRANSKQSLIGEENWTLVRTLLKQKWSPEQISGWLRNNSEINFYVSDQTIYEYIYADRENGGTLYQHLRRAGKSYKNGGRKVYRGKIKDRVDISARPDAINKRLRLGDWEA